MKQPNYKFFVFDGAVSHYFASIDDAIAFFIAYRKKHPEFADIIALHQIISFDCESRVLFERSDVDD